jgi:hypothetical protein
VGIMASRGDKQAQAEMDEVRGKYGLKQEWASGVREPQHVLQDMAPRALGAQLDAVGGWDRVHEPELVELPTGLAVNLCGGDSEEDWRSTRVGGWHKGEAVPRQLHTCIIQVKSKSVRSTAHRTDIHPLLLHHYRRLALSALLGYPAAGAAAHVLLQRHRARVRRHADHGRLRRRHRQGAGAVPARPELTGEAGDMAIIHPYMVHRVAANPSGRARFAQFPSIQLPR